MTSSPVSVTRPGTQEEAHPNPPTWRCAHGRRNWCGGFRAIGFRAIGFQRVGTQDVERNPVASAAFAAPVQRPTGRRLPTETHFARSRTIHRSRRVARLPLTSMTAPTSAASLTRRRSQSTTRNVRIRDAGPRAVLANRSARSPRRTRVGRPRRRRQANRILENCVG